MRTNRSHFHTCGSGRRGEFHGPAGVGKPAIRDDQGVERASSWRPHPEGAGRNVDRRCFLGGAGLVGLAAVGGIAGAVPLPAPPSEPKNGADDKLAVAVFQFGARGDGRKDNTDAFQKALDRAHAQGGGIVAVPAGRYLLKGHLVLPANTTLQGVFRSPPATVMKSGTVLLPLEGRGNADGPPFLSSHGTFNAGIRGLGIYYPEQDDGSVDPAPYPWTIESSGNDFSVQDVALTNTYQGINLAGSARHYVARVYGQPLLTGIYVDQCYDVGRIENIHFYPFWSGPPSRVFKWVGAHGVGIRIARSDWQYVLNTFVLGYNIGYHFVQSPDGPCNGNFVGLGADASGRAAVVVEQSQPPGLLITNGEFVGDQRPESEGLIVEANNEGPVRLQNCSFWGASNRIGTLRGRGEVSLIGCTFMSWDKNRRGEPAFLLDGAPATISNCSFRRWRGVGWNECVAAKITPRCASAVIAGNTTIGRNFIVQHPSGISPGRFQIAMNVAAGQ